MLCATRHFVGFWVARVMSSSSSSGSGSSCGGGRVSVERAAELLRAKRVVAFPTETVYGLGADARSDDAVAKIFSTKGRPQDNPLIVHVHSQAQLPDFVSHIPPLAQLLMDRCAVGGRRGVAFADGVTRSGSGRAL